MTGTNQPTRTIKISYKNSDLIYNACDVGSKLKREGLRKSYKSYILIWDTQMKSGIIYEVEFNTDIHRNHLSSGGSLVSTNNNKTINYDKQQEGSRDTSTTNHW